MEVIVYTFYQPYILQRLIFASGFPLHNYIEWQMNVIVYTICQPILASIDYCIRISMHNYIVGQMKVIVYTFYQPILARTDNCIRISLHYYIEEQMKVILYTFVSTNSCKY